MSSSLELENALEEQAAAIEAYTPIRARTGKLVHAITSASAALTACGRKIVSGIVVAECLTCKRCRSVAGI